MTVTATFPFTLNPDGFADIMDAAGFGCAYWAQQLSCNDDHTADILYDDDGKAVTRSVSLARAEALIAQIASGQSSIQAPELLEAFRRYVASGDAGAIDAAAADALIQLCVFGEIIYG